MSILNKRALAVAIVASLALPAIATAATLTYPNGKQITFAKDLIVDNGITIYTNNDLRLAAETTDSARIGTVVGGQTLRVKVTLTNGARFDANAPAVDLVGTFRQGAQTGGAASTGTIIVPTSAYYSAGGSELNFEYAAAGNGTVGANGDFALQLNSMQIANLVEGLKIGSSVSAQITVQNNLGQQILASQAVIARSKWGLAIEEVSGNTAKRIDVAGCATSSPATARKTRFSPSGSVGGSCTAGSTYFNAGGITLDIAKANPIGSTTPTYINNYSAVANNPQYNVVGTADVTVRVTGTNFAAFGGSRTWLDASASCDSAAAARVVGIIEAGNQTATYKVSATDPLWANVTNAQPSPATAYVCFAANSNVELLPQAIEGEVEVNYNLSTQRVDPPVMGFDLLDLQLNGTEMYFQNFNPAGNARAQSFLRLTNNNADSCRITVDAKDDDGKLSNGFVTTLAPHGSVHLNSEDLQNGNAAKGTGSFGAPVAGTSGGASKWYVRVSAECANLAGSALNRNFDTGVITDLTPAKGETWLTPPKRNP